MADRTHIEWTDATWNIVTGCDVVSPGCTNCYAMRLAGTRLKHHASRAGLTKPTRSGPVWTGEVRFNVEWLDQPLRWQKPRMIFVAAHGDLFHEAVTDEVLDHVFAVMALCPRHTFQVLTKRPARMREYLDGFAAWVRVERLLREMAPDDLWNGSVYEASRVLEAGMPLPNVWLGVSVEDQQRADERIPHLLATPAAVRFVSAEPLLGPVDLTRVDAIHARGVPMWDVNALTGEHTDMCRPCAPVPTLDWVIVGGESQAGARPMQDAWAYSLINQCRAAGVKFLMKQMGGHPRQRPTPDDPGRPDGEGVARCALKTTFLN